MARLPLLVGSLIGLGVAVGLVGVVLGSPSLRATAWFGMGGVAVIGGALWAFNIGGAAAAYDAWARAKVPGRELASARTTGALEVGIGLLFVGLGVAELTLR